MKSASRFLGKIHRFVCVGGALVAVVLTTTTLAHSAVNFNLHWSVIAAGGRQASSPAAAVNGSIGQPAAGVLGRGDFRLSGGFWSGASAGGAQPNPPSFFVNTTNDVDDGTCNAAHCSLREALAASSRSGPDTIGFSISTSDPGYDPATGVWTIRPTTTYNVPSDTTVDGSIGTGEFARPGIEIDGTTLAQQGLSGLWMYSGASLRGVVVNHFQYGVWVGGANVTVERCYIGTDAAGVLAKPNGLDGILVATGATTTTIQNNVLSGNGGSGVRMFGDQTTRNIIRLNRIGTTADGTAALPNGYYGVEVHAGAHGNSIGPDNLIAFNTWGGVEVQGATTLGNTITRNHVYSNTGIGIKLSAGGNMSLAAPSIATVSPTLVSGAACAGCSVEVFSDTAGQGAVYEGMTVADPAGHWTFAKPGGLAGPYVTATATDGVGNTSEFSLPASLALATATVTASPTASATPSRTSTATPTQTATPSATASRTPTPTATPTPSRTGTPTTTRTVTPTVTPTPTVTGTPVTPTPEIYLYLPIVVR